MNFLRRWFSRRGWEREMNDELRDHIERQTAANIASGMTPQEGRRQAMLQLGAVEGVKEGCREERSGFWLETLWADVRYGLRMLRKSPGFTAVAVVTLALGIGVNTSVFSLMDIAFLRPLVVPEANQVVILSRGGNPLFSYDDYSDYRDRNLSFAALTATIPTESSLDYQGLSRATAAEAVSGNYEQVMRVKPLLGRWFTDENDRVAVISYQAWQTLFASDPNVIGKLVRSESLWYTVIGVAPPEFTGIYAPIRTDIWVPMRIWTGQYSSAAAQASNQDRPRVMVLGRLKQGVAPSQAGAELAGMDAQIQKENPGAPSRTAPILVEKVSGAPNPNTRRDAVPFLVLLFAVVGTILMIACVNVGNLLLARGAVRNREFAVRVSLGAGRTRLFRQLLTESLLLSVLGTIVGLVVAHWTNRLLEAMFLSLPIDAPIQLNLRLDLRVFLFAAAMAFAAMVLSGMLPAWTNSRVDVAAVLKGDAPTVRGFRLRHASLVAQVALSFTLLLCASLFLRSLVQMRTIDPGFAVENRLYALTYISQPEFTSASGRQFYAKVLDDLRAMPGVRGASLTQLLPLQGQPSDCVSAGDIAPFRSTFAVIDSGFLATMNIPLVDGREFTLSDKEDSSPVVILNQALARRLWPHHNAIGQRVRIGCNSQIAAEVVGVARDTKVVSLTESASPHFYVPFSQNYNGLATIVIQTSGNAAAMTETVRRALLQENSSVRVYAAESLASHLERSFWQVRWEVSVLLIFGFLALTLAAMGLYGIIAYHVTQRKHEIGVRIAIGAQARHVYTLILRQSLLLTVTGIGIGLLMSLGLARLLARFLSGLSATDPVAYVATAALWLGVASLACLVPARRAMRVDPMIALRYE
jgi:predicted permease